MAVSCDPVRTMLRTSKEGPSGQSMSEGLSCFQRRYSECLLFIMGCIIIGCSSLHKDAETLMEGEAYDEARQVYAQILAKDPKDAKAIVGLRKARLKWIDTKLIDVRMLRLSKQAGPAAELLKKIIEREREWQFYPEGAVQYTQEEETQYAVPFITAQIEAWQSKDHLLKARAFLKEYRPIFATPQLLKRFEGSGNLLKSSGKEKCRKFSDDFDPALPYLATFVKRYCDSWGVPIEAGFDIAKVRATELFRELQVMGEAEGIPEALQSQWRESLTKTFQGTAWYDLKATDSLLVSVKAAYEENHTKEVEHTVHPYTVSVPYTAMVPRQQSYQEPYTTYKYQCSFDYTRCRNVPVTKYRTAYKTVMVPVTRYRQDPRQFPYDRFRHHQLLIFHADLHSIVQDTEAQAVHIQKADNTDTEHPHLVPKVGLHPDPLTLPDPLSWLERQIDKAASKWGRALSAAWIRVHCSAPESAVTGPTVADYVLRCLRERQHPIPAFADTWYREHFGAGREEVDQWL